MKRSWIVSALLTMSLTLASIAPAIADDDKKGRGKDNGNHKSESHRQDDRDKNRGKSKWKDDNRSNNDDRRSSRWDIDRREREARARQEEERRDRARREDQWNRDRNQNGSWVDGRYQNQRDLNRLSDQRQKTKNEWRNIALLSGAVGILGLLKHDNTLMFVGAAGALYSLDRYEKDRKSQSKIDRLRASYFSRDYFVRDGRRYDRQLVRRNGERYYQFVCR